MRSIHLFELTSKHNQWLSVRQATVATNVANVNTPGFKAQDTKPFEAVLESAGLSMRATTTGHMTTAGQPAEVTQTSDGDAIEIMHSGNSVNLESEMMKASEANRAYALNTNVIKAFHRMMLASSKG
jgi:flagellar basal-body rod protein FlgB